MRNQCLGLALLMGAAVLTVAQTKPPVATSMFTSTTMTPTGKTVARVNGTALTDHDLLREMLTIFPYARQHGGKFPESMEADIRRGALDMLEFEELVYQEAARRQRTVPSARLDMAMKTFRQQFNSPEEYSSYLKSECGGSTSKLREKIRRSMMIEDLLQVEVSQKAAVKNADVQAYYEKNPARFLSPESVSVQTISLLIPDNATPQQEASVRKRAEDALQQARKTKSSEEFGMLAEKISEDDWRVMMGDHQFISRNQMPPEVAKVAFAMKPGQVSELIRAENSWCIVRVNGQKASSQTSYEQVKDSLKKELEANKVDTLRRTLHQQLRKNARVEEL
jgi:parvulin-like peptidyl-prolyl cis-trans isomerase-like protein/SurA-like protein